MVKRQKANEFELIERFFAPLSASQPGAFNLTDDGAVLAVGEGLRLVITTDTLIAGVHFPADCPASAVATKSLAVNLSDLAAMGADAMAFTLCISIDKSIDNNWLDVFSNALNDEQKKFQVTLVGGDTVATPGPLSLTICALGTVAEGAELRRSKALVGDIIYVSGSIGDAALGLKLLQKELADQIPRHRDFLIERYYRPQPRLKLGRRLGGIATAAIDVSDGLVADIGHICAASGVGAIIEADRIPLSAAARAILKSGESTISTLLTGGDDYEILFTARPESSGDIERIATELDLSLTAIGKTTEKRDSCNVSVIDDNGDKLVLDKKGYRHF